MNRFYNCFKIVSLFFSVLFFMQIFSESTCTISLQEQFSRVGYLEVCDNNYGIATYDSLYADFDELITFLQANPAWAQKLYIAKERFIIEESLL